MSEFCNVVWLDAKAGGGEGAATLHVCPAPLFGTLNVSWRMCPGSV